jgi:AP-3 complex subunit beta
MDPPHTRIIKIDILVSLALEPAAIEAVLKELRTYIRSGDKKFACAAIRAVGRVAELARIVYDRHGQKSGNVVKGRTTANRIALDCLHGLSVVTQTCDGKIVVGEAVSVMQNIMVMLLSDAGDDAGSLMHVEDPNDVQGFAMRRILLLLVNSLSSRRTKEDEEDGNEGSNEDEDEPEPSDLEKISLELPPQAVASALWLVGEWISNMVTSPITLRKVDDSAKFKMRIALAHLLDQAFPDLDSLEKEQGIHFASKLLVSGESGATLSSSSETAICEHILAMGRVDVNPDVKDRARFESAIIQATVGLKHDTDAMDDLPSIIGGSLTTFNAKKMLLVRKPAPSFLPVEDENTVDTSSFRFGTLSSLVGHQARGAYLPLPSWGEKNSPKALRDPVVAVKAQMAAGVTPEQPATAGGFYGGSESSESSDGQDADSESDSNSSSDDSSSSSDSDDGNNLLMSTNKLPTAPTNGMQNNLLGLQPIMMAQSTTPQAAPAMQSHFSSQPSSYDESSSNDDSSSAASSSSSSSSDDENYNGDDSSANIATPNEGNLLSMGTGMPAPNNSSNNTSGFATNGSSSAMDDLKGLVMAPIVLDESSEASDPDIEDDSSAWIQLVRPELCGGLSVRARYLRGRTKEREVQLKGLDPNSPSVICVQVQFGNKYVPLVVASMFVSNPSKDN